MTSLASTLWTKQHFGAGEILVQPGGLAPCYLVTRGLISICFGADAVGVGLIGPGGIVNIGPILGTDELMHTVITVTDCETLRMEACVLHGLCRQNGRFEGSIARYLQARLNQTMAVAACHIRHSLEQRLASWIGAANTMLQGLEIRVTHQQLALLLGVQRTSVTVALEILEGRQAIWSKRSRILVRDGKKLSQYACGCLTPIAPFFREQSLEQNSVGDPTENMK